MATASAHADRVALVSNLGAIKALLRRVKRDLPDRGRSAGVLVLAILHRTGPSRLRDLADEADLDLSVVSRLTAELTAAGYVERRPNPEDRRSSLLAITPEGVRRHEEAMDRAAKAIEPVLQEWSDEDVALLSDLLGRLHHSFQSQLGRSHCKNA
ncbi:MarR family winged helix-turn-helix transcriptional regulator [Streptacidiphilus jiangxiensis]|uniref:DNA-binding transcriptional regulator, MarR family n=1 Tax=Streptacidiphilus jiangxiensis TaxID=235985 RepID=A0A1H7VGY4_STRJI|nr:MarR family transcriptional regulator [Streptacidiphilus jiangxiensis]SEM08088.1 DNA-binding transcriptional regulator, MarR family [Streptacidiphilus jiangxiensis]